MFVNHWGRWVDSDNPVTGVVSLNSLEWIHDLTMGDVIDLTYEEGWKEFLRDKVARMPHDPSKQPGAIRRLRRADGFADCWIAYGDDFVVSASDDPLHPQGVWSYNDVRDWSKWNRELGVTVDWGDLPLTLRRYLVEWVDSDAELTPTEEEIAEWREEYNECDQPPATYLVGAWRQDEEGLYEPDDLTDDKEFSAIVSYDSMTAQVVRSKWVRAGALCSPCYPGQVDLDTPGDYLGFDFPQWVYGEMGRNPQAQSQAGS